MRRTGRIYVYNAHWIIVCFYFASYSHSTITGTDPYLESGYHKQADDPELVGETWWHGRAINFNEANQMLAERSFGCFLVRESQQKESCYSLHVKHRADVSTFYIQVTPTGRYTVEGSQKEFESLPELIKFYKRSFLSVSGEILKEACPNPNTLRRRTSSASLDESDKNSQAGSDDEIIGRKQQPKARGKRLLCCCCCCC